MAKICLSLTAKTIEKNLQVLEKHRQSIDLAELRVDCLNHEEYTHIRGFPQLAGIPVILTVRRKIDGGCFEGGESYRLVILSKGLAFAEPDERRNFAYVDIEEDLDVPGLEEAARAFGTRIIRSFHSFRGDLTNLKERINLLYRVGDEIAKAAIMPKSLADVKTIVRAAKELSSENNDCKKDKIVIAMGDLGHCTRILAEKLGSYLTYAYSADAAAPAENKAGAAGAAVSREGAGPPAPGMCEVTELINTFNFKTINKETAVYGLSGFPLKSSGSPAFHNPVFRAKNKNAIYIRFPSPTIESFLSLADELEMQGASVTVPHKEAVIKYLRKMSSDVNSIGACNTIVRLPAGGANGNGAGANGNGGGVSGNGGGWSGFNTDIYGFSDSLTAFMEKNGVKKNNINKKKFTIIGAGGAARAVAAAISALKAKALILNRNMVKAQALAKLYGFEYGALDEAGISFMRKFNDVIVQTTTVGNENDVTNDPVSLYRFKGSELVIDIIYKPAKTKFLQRALAAGCPAMNGEDMLQRQAQLQSKIFLGE